MSKNKRIWTEQEDLLIMQKGVSVTALCEVLNRTEYSIRTRQSILRKRDYKSEEEIAESKRKQEKRVAYAQGIKEKVAEYTANGEYSEPQKQIIEKAIRADIDVSPLLNPKFHPLQMNELLKAIQSGHYDPIMANPIYNHHQIKEFFLGLQNGVNIEYYAHSGFSYAAMRQIRLGLEAGLPVQFYACPIYNDLQMEQLRLALQEKLPIEKIANPIYNWEQMKVLRGALKTGIDISLFNSPSLSAEQMKAEYIRLRDLVRGVYPVKSASQIKQNLSLEELDAQNNPFVIHSRNKEDTLDAEQELSIYGYNVVEYKKLSEKSATCYFYCNPSTKEVVISQNKPKDGNFISYHNLRGSEESEEEFEAAPIENWVSINSDMPKKSGIYKCMIRNPETYSLEEHLVFANQDAKGKLCFESDAPVVFWLPHVNRRERYQKEKESQIQALTR